MAFLNKIFKITYADARLVLLDTVKADKQGMMSVEEATRAFDIIARDSGHPTCTIFTDSDTSKYNMGHLLQTHSHGVKMSVDHIYALSKMDFLYVFMFEGLGKTKTHSDKYFIVRGEEEPKVPNSGMMIPYTNVEIKTLNRLAKEDLVWGVYFDAESKTFDVANANVSDPDVVLSRTPCIKYVAGAKSQVSGEFGNPNDASMIVERHNHAVAAAYRLGQTDAVRK